MEQFKVHKILTKIIREKQMQKGNKKPVWFWLLLTFLAILGVAFLTVFIFFLFLIKGLPNVNDFGKLNFAQSTLILDRQGNELYSIHGEENRKLVSLQEIPDALVKATLAIEDAQFFEHKGFDLKGILRAVWTNFTNPDEKTGGSTITQQFVKNTYLTREKTYIRKLKELILSVQLENKFSKEKIMEMYLNSIPYGSNAYGVESAAETFFAKTVSELTLAESVVLAALPQAPTYYSPYGQHKLSNVVLETEENEKKELKSEQDIVTHFPNAVQRGLIGKVVYLTEDNPIYIKGRSDLVLLRMQELGYVSDEEKQVAWEKIQALNFRSARTNIKAPHFVMYVKEELEKKYGKDVIEQGGLRVYTTLNPRLQQIAEEFVVKQGEINVNKCGAKNASLVSLDPKTGQVLAMVGSRDYWDTENDGNVNVTLMNRLPGSSFKPFAYAAGFLKGYSPATVFFDLETDFGGDYKPKNFDGRFRGPVTARVALGNSLNIPAVKMGFLAGNKNVYELAKAMGLNFERDSDWYGGALPLGVAEVRSLDLVGAYNVFANNGKKIPTTPFLRVEDAAGNILEEWKEPKQEIVLDEQVAYLITNILSDATARGPGWNSYLQLSGRENAVKTGTSNKKIKNVTYPFDGWTLGYTPQLVTGVWIGNNDGSVLNLNASGFTCASPIWKNYMEKALEGVPEEKFKKPEGLKWINVSKLSGLLPTQWTPDSLVKSEIFAQINAPNRYDNTLKVVEVDKVSGKLPTQYTPKDAIETRAVINFHSLMPDVSGWERPVQGWVKSHAATYLANMGVQNILATIPEDYDDVHTAENTDKAPEIEIVAPVAYGAVSPPNIGVVTKIQSTIGIQKVEFYWNNELMDTATKSPWKGNLRVNDFMEIGSKHIILVKAYDRVYNTSTAKIEVVIAADDQAPYTEIVFPKEGDSLQAGSSVTVKTYSYDAKSDIDKVVFYLNDQEIGVVKKAPYEYTIQLPTEAGRFTVKVVAFDQVSNFSEDTVVITTTEMSTNNGGQTRITTPKQGQKLNQGESVAVGLEVPQAHIGTLQELDLIVQELDTKKMNILANFTSFDSGWSGKFITTWMPPKTGQYEFFVRSKDLQGKIFLSTKIKVTIE